MILTIHTTTYTLNEVYGTACGDCGATDFSPQFPSACAACGSDNLDAADGCSVPYDDDHCTTEELLGLTPWEVAQQLRDVGLTDFDGRVACLPDDSRSTDCYTGEREEVTASVEEVNAGELEELDAIWELLGDRELLQSEVWELRRKLDAAHADPIRGFTALDAAGVPQWRVVFATTGYPGVDVEGVAADLSEALEECARKVRLLDDRAAASVARGSRA